MGTDESRRDVFDEEVYQELRAIAAKLMIEERVNHTLQPTALVTELWLRFKNICDLYEDRQHFRRAAALAMRRLLIDHARKHRRRIEGKPRVSLDVLVDQMSSDYPDLMAFDEALKALKREYPTWYEAFILVYFGGYTEKEVAEHLDMQVDTIKRYLRNVRSELEQRVMKTKE